MDTRTTDTGGPAFPTVPDSSPLPAGHFRTQYLAPGMTLLDWFAGQARHEDLAIPETIGECAKLIGIDAGSYEGSKHWNAVDARLRYDWASAMLAEKRRREGAGGAP